MKTTNIDGGVSSHDFAREHEVDRYYQPFLDSAGLKAVPANGPYDQRSSVHPSCDTTLTALAQLATLRLNVKRGTISLIGATTQIILAEATQTLSLVDGTRHDPGDHVGLGQVSLPRKDCIDEHVFAARWEGKDSAGHEQSLSALVINDVTTDDRFKDRPYVVSNPGVKFYAGVPIVTKNGFEIGVYAVSDTVPHLEGLTGDQVLFMHDVAHIVTNHLERIKSTIDSDRDKAFVRGMHTFIEGLADLKQDITSPLRDKQAHESTEQPDVQATDPQDDEYPTSTTEHVPNPNESHPDPAEFVSESGAPKTSDDTIDRSPKFVKESESLDQGKVATTAYSKRQIFQRAAMCIRDVTDAQGCTFLDASSSIFTAGAVADTSETTSRSPRQAQDTDPDWDADLDSTSEFDQMADILSSSFAPEKSQSSYNGSLERRHLRHCLLHYPFGKYFHLNRGTVTLPISNNSMQETVVGGGLDTRSPSLPKTALPTASDRKQLPKPLLNQLRHAKWLIFLPLYNFAQAQWCAAALIWSKDTDSSDLETVMPYLKTFGSCLMSEVTSMEAFNTSIAKSTFIASISHDLRSPLHGMLGCLEFLEDTMTTAYQMSLLDSIETCGKTLLDTIDHLLDYAKINNLNRAVPESDRVTNSNETLSVQNIPDHTLPSFDASLLLEEVVEAVFAGQTFRKTKVRKPSADDTIAKIHAMNLDEVTPPEDQIHAGSTKFSGKVFLILNVRKVKSWCLQGHPGALRRVIMNVVGNAIKYCSLGYIEIMLDMEDQNNSNTNVAITVKDTGVGMSQNFMENHLFKAFSQENSFSMGAGLGLSIASQIAQNLKGNIRVQSERGVGTHVKICFPMSKSPQTACESEAFLLAAIRVTRGKQICLLNPDIRASQLSRLTASVAHTCEEWFHMTCSKSKEVQDNSGAHVFVYCEPPPIEYLLQQHSERRGAGKDGTEAALLIICTNAFEAAALRAAGVAHLTSLGRTIEVISQPVGIRKLAKVLLSSLQRVERKASSVGNEQLSKVAREAFGTSEAEQRASEVDWNTSSIIYDETSAKHRPSVEVLRWKSAEPTVKVLANGGANEPKSDIGAIKTGHLPGLQFMNHKSMDKPDGNSGPPSVLLVDDNAINLKLLVTFMKKIKLPYAEAVNGLEALDKFKAAEKPFDYVLMDLQMPIMNGLESTRRIREYEKYIKRPKAATILAITGVGSESVRKEAMDAGMTRFIMKPVNFKSLKQLLEQER